MSELGNVQLRTIELAVDDFGPIRGHNVEIAGIVDDRCDPETARDGARSIISDETALGVIGTTCAETVTSALSVLSDAGLVMVSGAVTGPNLTSDLAGNRGNAWLPGFYRTAGNDLFHARAAARYALQTLSISDAAVVKSPEPEYEQLSDAFGQAYRADEGTIVATFDAEDAGVSSSDLIELAEAGVGFIYLATPAQQAESVIGQIRSRPGLEDIVVFGTAELAEAVESRILPFMTEVYFPKPAIVTEENEVTGVGVDDLSARYMDEYGVDPVSPHFTAAYDATILLLRAIEEASEEDAEGSLIVDRIDLRNHLDTTSEITGVTGPLHCSDYGDCGSSLIGIYRVNENLVAEQVDVQDGNSGTQGD